MEEVNRQTILDAASEAVCDRGPAYGTPRENFDRVAGMWTTILGFPVSSDDVALMMVAFKVARLCATPSHTDSWVDIAGYAAVGAESNASYARTEGSPHPFQDQRNTG